MWFLRFWHKSNNLLLLEFTKLLFVRLRKKGTFGISNKGWAFEGRWVPLLECKGGYKNFESWLTSCIPRPTVPKIQEQCLASFSFLELRTVRLFRVVV